MCDELTVHALVADDVAVTTTSAVGVGLAESDNVEDDGEDWPILYTLKLRTQPHSVASLESSCRSSTQHSNEDRAHSGGI